MDRLLERLAAAGGALFVVLVLIGDDTIAHGDCQDVTDARAAIARCVRDHYSPSKFLLGRAIGLIGLAMFVLFLIALHRALREADQGSPWLVTVQLAAGLVAVGLGLAAYAPHFVAHVMLTHGGLSDDLAVLLYVLETGFFVGFMLAFGLALAATATIVIRSGALPKSLGWTAAALAAGALAGVLTVPGPIIFQTLFASFFWLIATSLVLVRRSLRRTVVPARTNAPVKA